MPEEKLQTLSLQVINGSELESGRAARCLFTQQGNVGHGPECHWSVQDRQQSIPAQAFTVILHDGTFCLRPQTAQLWLNQAKVTATSDLIQLRQGDEIQIGRLMVRVHLNRGDIPHYDEEMATPETIVTNRDMLTDTLLSNGGYATLSGNDSPAPTCRHRGKRFFCRSTPGTSVRKPDYHGRSAFRHCGCPAIGTAVRSGK